MRFALLLALFSAACIVPPQGGGGSDALLSQVEKDLSQYLTDHENGVAFVRCLGNSSEFYASPAEAARSIAAGCDAALAVAIPRMGRVQDIDPVTVDGTTVGFVVRYATQLDEPPSLPPVDPEPPVPYTDPSTTQPTKMRSTPPPAPEAAPSDSESVTPKPDAEDAPVTPKPEDNEPVTPKP